MHAALYRCLIRRLCVDETLNAGVDAVDRAFAEENKWRAERFGTKAALVNRTSSAAKPLDVAVGELIALLHDDAAALGCLAEIKRAAAIVSGGSSASGQVHVYAQDAQSA
jgi:glutamate---cysteine ligase / carboxylate-amine ligase